MTVSDIAALIAEKEAVLADVRCQRQALSSRIDAEARQAGAAVRESYSAETGAVSAAETEAYRAVLVAKEQLPDHPWTGKRVFKMVSRGRVWERLEPLRVEGIVETMRSATSLPTNTPTYSRPSIGEGIVRMLKADGSPGLKFESLRGNVSWKLVEEQAQ